MSSPKAVTGVNLIPVDLAVGEAWARIRAQLPNEIIDNEANQSPPCHCDSNPVGNTARYTRDVSKVMVSLPDDLLAEVDAEAKRRSTSRSALLASAARRELVRRDSAELTRALDRSERRFRGSGSFESADIVRSDRDDRR